MEMSREAEDVGGGVRERAGWGLLECWTHSQTHPHQHGQYSKINLYASNLIGRGGSQKLRTAYTHVVVVSMVSQEEVQRVTQQQLRLNFSHGDVAVCVCVDSVGRAYGRLCWQQPLDAVAVVWPPSGET